MIQIKYNEGVKTFPETSTGEKQSIAFCESLKSEYIKHPYFLNLDNIAKLKAKKFNAIGYQSERRYQTQIHKLERIRQKWLRENPTIQPLPLRIEILKVA